MRSRERKGEGEGGSRWLDLLYVCMYVLYNATHGYIDISR